MNRKKRCDGPGFNHWRRQEQVKNIFSSFRLAALEPMTSTSDYMLYTFIYIWQDITWMQCSHLNTGTQSQFPLLIVFLWEISNGGHRWWNFKLGECQLTITDQSGVQVQVPHHSNVQIEFDCNQLINNKWMPETEQLLQSMPKIGLGKSWLT